MVHHVAFQFSFSQYKKRFRASYNMSSKNNNQISNKSIQFVYDAQLFSKFNCCFLHIAFGDNYWTAQKKKTRNKNSLSISNHNTMMTFKWMHMEEALAIKTLTPELNKYEQDMGTGIQPWTLSQLFLLISDHFLHSSHISSHLLFQQHYTFFAHHKHFHNTFTWPTHTPIPHYKFTLHWQKKAKISIRSLRPARIL